VRAVRFGHGAAWATLDLAEDESVSVMALQSADKDRAVRAVRELRAMLAAHRAAVSP
jgi:thioesterase domain-containing protein